MALSDKLYTISELEALAESEPERILELIDGRIVEKVTNEKHGKIAGSIVGELRFWVKRSQISGHWGVENTYRLPEDVSNERRPDVSFRYAAQEPSEVIYVGMPDFAVEIKSRKNTYDELRDKAKFYLEHGARLVWLVYPAKQLVEVYYADKSSELFTLTDTLDGGDVLPGFQMTVADIFEL